ncbi:MAG: DMT family transporter [Deferribacterales bacterium]
MNYRNWLLLITLSIVWGGSFYFIEKSLVYFAFEQVVFFRVLFAAVFILPVLIVKRVRIVLDLRLWGMFLIMGSLNNVIPFLGITYAQESITASLASLFNATTPIFTAAFAHVLTKDEKISPLKALGILTGFAGMVILLLPSGFGSFESAGMFAIMGAVSYACAGIFGKRLKGYDPVLNVFGMLSSSALIMYCLFFTSINSLHVESLYEFKDLILLSLVSTSMAYVIYFTLLFRVGAVKLLLVTYLIPVSASVLGIFLLNEKFTLNMLAGALIIFVSLWLINRD